MAIVEMQKMSLVAHIAEKAKLFRVFVKSGCVEMINSDLGITVKHSDREKKDDLERKRFRAEFCLNFLKDISKEISRLNNSKSCKVNFKKENRLIKLEEYEEVCNNTEEIFNKIDEMESVNNRIVELRSELVKLNAFNEQLSPYKYLDVNMSLFSDDAYVANFCGIVDSEKISGLYTKIQELQKDFPVHAELFFSDNSNSVIVIDCDRDWNTLENLIMDKYIVLTLVCLQENKMQILKLLNEYEFVKTPFNFDKTPVAQIKENAERITIINDTIRELIIGSTDYIKYAPTAKIIYDYYSLELAKLSLTEKSTRTQKAILLEAWIPKKNVEDLNSEIKKCCSRYEISFRDPVVGEIPPTSTVNSKLVSPFAGITEMFGVPNYKERDPNLFVALFYFLIFGIMIGDAGYGLLMTIACFTFLKIKKPVKATGRIMTMFAFCGISTFLWGILFGGWFAIELTEDSFFNKIMWFSPLNEPLKMFMLSLAIGVIQIGTGFFLNGLASITSKNKLKIIKGIFSDLGWDVILLGLLMLFPNILVYLGAIDDGVSWYATIGKVGTYTAVVGAIMILVGGAIGKKTPIKMVGGSLGSLYGAINIVSDLLSYSRLFGLGLTTGVIGLVMNKLGMIIVEIIGPIGWVLAIIIFIVGHLFNLAINLLGAYVHDSRLQYIEFFGRFYEGNGHAFKPLGSNLKYTYLDN